MGGGESAVVRHKKKAFRNVFHLQLFLGEKKKVRGTSTHLKAHVKFAELAE